MPRIVVGMSGGVDSSVAAMRLLEQGHQVEAVFMKNWEADDRDAAYCTAAEDLQDAQQVCDELEIPLHCVNFAKVYWDRVFTYFLAEYRRGRTPNPDVLCNTEIKFKAFLSYAMKLGADAIATGHYARVMQDDQGLCHLYQAFDTNKDQSYFLHALGQEALANAIFPLGQLTKTDVRKMAMDAGLVNHNKKDSTGICFIGERRFKDFLARYLPAKPGRICTLDGELIGEHSGLMFYTLGQRQGIGVGGVKNASEAPWYVVSKDRVENILYVAQGDAPELYKTKLYLEHVHWISGRPPELPYACDAKVRYRQTQQRCCVRAYKNDRYIIEFEVPQRAVAEGQSLVLYQGEECLGGGVIDATQE